MCVWRERERERENQNLEFPSFGIEGENQNLEFPSFQIERKSKLGIFKFSDRKKIETWNF